MADITDVFLKIKYRKNGEIQEDDILEDTDMYNALADMEYDGIEYEDEEELILRTMGRNYYPDSFEIESDLRDYLFEISKEKEIEDIYHIFYEFSFIMEVVRCGIIHTDIVNKKVSVDIIKEESYLKIFESKMKESYPELLKKYEVFIEGELDDDDEYEFEEKMNEIMEEYSLTEFRNFLSKVKLENK